MLRLTLRGSYIRAEPDGRRALLICGELWYSFAAGNPPESEIEADSRYYRHGSHAERKQSKQPHQYCGYENELKDLAMVINTMLDRIERSYNSQKQFVSDASHELNGRLR